MILFLVNCNCDARYFHADSGRNAGTVKNSPRKTCRACASVAVWTRLRAVYWSLLLRSRLTAQLAIADNEITA